MYYREAAVLLPRFEAPPVVETVIGLFFQPPSAFSIEKRVLFWQHFKAKFPIVEEKPPVDEVQEVFDGSPAGREIRWQVLGHLPSPRLFAKSPDRKHTLQIQSDAIFTNWERDEKVPDPYLKFDLRLLDFEEKLKELEHFFGEHKLGDLIPTSGTLTYINHLEAPEDTPFGETLGNVFTLWSNQSSDNWLPSPEGGEIKASFRMRENSGRLHFAASPAIRNADKKRLLRFELTARSSAFDRDPASSISWYNAAHEWIVRGFASITRPAMHNVWERKT